MEQRIKGLILKLSQGKCSEEEIDLLLEYFNSGDLKSLEKEMKKQWDSNNFVPASEEKLDELWEKLKSKSESDFKNDLQKNKKSPWRNLYKYAAIFIGVLFLSVFFFKDRITRPDQTDAITVEFGDGKVEVLDTGVIDFFQEPGLVLENDKLRYSTKGHTSGKLEYHTIRIPFGMKFQLVLSDSTVIHLNSGSTLKYPVKFIEGKERLVYLEGEAFFKVAKAKEKFTVKASSLETEVLGTEFNVSSYPKDAKAEVVLLEGSVEVHSEESQILRPNQKLTYLKTTKNWEIEQVNAADYISWVDGVIWFKNENFRDIIPKLERHYNVRISNNFRELEYKTFTGRFETEGIHDVLNVFKTATDFDYVISAEKITIKAPKKVK